jgi:nucleoside-diphosphate-sugar epimerase
MRIFVTGASGFVGSAIVDELLSAGHQVLGMVRSDAAAEKLNAIGAQAHRGDLYKPATITSGAESCDAVIHTAFNHDFRNFKENCETDRQVIGALASVLAGTGKPLLVTSAIGLLTGFDRTVIETDVPKPGSPNPRVASEEAVKAAQNLGADTYIVRLSPTVHGKGDHGGFIPTVIGIDKEKGISAYIDNGQNRWSAVHRLDAATLFRLVVEQRPAQKVFHAVAEEGIPFIEIAKAIAEGMHLSVISKTAEEAAKHFGWFSHFASINCPASSAQTRAVTGWKPQHTGLMADLIEGDYFN